MKSTQDGYAQAGPQSFKRGQVIFMRVLIALMAFGFLGTALFDAWSCCSLLARGLESRGRVPTTGRIEDSYVHETVSYGNGGYRSRGAPSHVYTPVVKYSFEVAGSRHTSQNIYLKPGLGSSGRRFASEKVREYPKGSTVAVYYAPGNPRECTLEVGVFRSYLMGPMISMMVWGIFGVLSVKLFLWLW